MPLFQPPQPGDRPATADPLDNLIDNATRDYMSSVVNKVNAAQAWKDLNLGLREEHLKWSAFFEERSKQRAQSVYDLLRELDG